MTPRPRPDLLIVLSIEQEHGVTEFAGQVCYRSDGTGYHPAGLILNPTWQYPSGRYDAYADLSVRATLDPDRRNNSGRPYAWRYEYHQPHSVDLDRAAAMSALLRRVARRITAIDNQLGYPTGLGDYVARFCQALAITAFATRSEEPGPDGTPWTWLDTDGMRQWISSHCDASPR